LRTGCQVFDLVKDRIGIRTMAEIEDQVILESHHVALVRCRICPCCAVTSASTDRICQIKFCYLLLYFVVSLCIARTFQAVDDQISEGEKGPRWLKTKIGNVMFVFVFAFVQQMVGEDGVRLERFQHTSMPVQEYVHSLKLENYNLTVVHAYRICTRRSLI
jgi:hypothetical protein